MLQSQNDEDRKCKQTVSAERLVKYDIYWEIDPCDTSFYERWSVYLNGELASASALTSDGPIIERNQLPVSFSRSIKWSLGDKFATNLARQSQKGKVMTVRAVGRDSFRRGLPPRPELKPRW